MCIMGTIPQLEYFRKGEIKMEEMNTMMEVVTEDCCEEGENSKGLGKVLLNKYHITDLRERILQIPENKYGLKAGDVVTANPYFLAY